METGDVKLLSAFPGADVGRIRQVAFLPKGRTLIIVGSLGVALLDLEAARATRHISAPLSSEMLCMAVSRDGKLLATGDDEGRVTHWDIATGAKNRVLTIEGKYQIRWPAPATLLVLWIILYLIATIGGRLARARSERG